MDSQKVSGMVVLHTNDRTYSNTYLITFKVARAHTCSIDPTVVGSTSGKYRFEFHHHIQFYILHGCETYSLEDYF